MVVELDVEGGCCCGRGDTNVAVWVRCPNPYNKTTSKKKLSYTVNPICLKAARAVIPDRSALEGFLYKHADLLDKL